VQSPGDRNGSVLTLPCLSGRRLDELRAALESGGRTMVLSNPASGPGPSTIERYRIWRRTSVASAPAHGLEVVAVLTTVEMLMAAATNSSISLILLAVLAVWFKFSEYVPVHASQFMKESVEPQGVVAVLLTLVTVAIVAGLVLGAVRLNRFTLVRDGDVLRTSRGLLGKQTATISARRVQAVRIV
jgi:putative membrane protein